VRPKTATFPPIRIFETPQLIATGRTEPRHTPFGVLVEPNV